MKLLSCEVTNFGSYKHLSIDFSDLGLALMYGRTGSGKSTIPDMACWALFGQTAKNGSVDEVRSWTADGEATKGVLTLSTPTGELTVTRIRGKTKDNDLYWTEATTPDKLERGKDIADTQRKLEKRIGMDADSYISGSYFHEFIPSGNFFTANAKARREIFEKIAVLDLPALLAAASSEARKEIKEGIAELKSTYDKSSGRLEAIKNYAASTVVSSGKWIKEHAEAIRSLTESRDSFEVTKAKEIARLKALYDNHEAKLVAEVDQKIAELQKLEGRLKSVSSIETDIFLTKTELETTKTHRCGKCGGPGEFKEVQRLNEKLQTLTQKKAEAVASDREFDALAMSIKALQDSSNPYDGLLQKQEALENTYDDRIKAEKAKTNPFEAQLRQNDAEAKSLAASLTGAKADLAALEHKYNSLTQLYDLSSDLRGELLKRTVKNIEHETNRYLEAYFDAEIRVQFDIDGSDDLDVKIQKSGYECVYRQLSKGQRSLLRLCFCVAIMEASANKSGVHHDNLFFDESMDGMDSDLKVKAFNLFEELGANHSSVLVIDHATEFQNLFNRRYCVEMVADSSEITLEE